MLKLVPNPTFKAPVEFGLPEGGNAKVVIEFKHMGRKVLAAWIEKFQPKEGEEVLTDDDALVEVAVGWEGVDAPFNKENLAKLMDAYPSFVRAAIGTYIPALLEGRQKNSK